MRLRIILLVVATSSLVLGRFRNRLIVRSWKKTSSACSTKASSSVGWCTRTIRFISSTSGKSMKWKTHRRRNANATAAISLGNL